MPFADTIQSSGYSKTKDHSENLNFHTRACENVVVFIQSNLNALLYEQQIFKESSCNYISSRQRDFIETRSDAAFFFAALSSASTIHLSNIFILWFIEV